MRNAKLKSDSGLTLIEVMTAMVVLSVGILALAPMMIMSIQGNEQSSDLTMATMVAQDSLERLTALDPIPGLPYERMAVDTTSGLTSKQLIDNSGSDPSVPAGMNRFQVTVFWTDDTGVDRSFEYSTLRVE